ncbi:flagellar biosynthesis anti-sigma factor FlgM [Sulfurimonas sp.]|jgi:anti-sigma28 factor (negative regulator of flagellin synthesis)|uniref:flagellar biosynthesis anti-sigma factor FlgM n=1 Tax=Sulfurimonas sp. TaxID=2022749 RepID=UPI0025F2FF21|nr:flagellar biosynthesis anti-sigma factor FlgM [Sulfurimonas sp.]MCK9473156.1 flagellar biosynthesis anti-sigma factor FlgM [Sulfurimonas sp.]MDD3506440.1 flagellar biosynthesis anti-sigma factor FlgM [Sulfurimonas sp.]
MISKINQAGVYANSFEQSKEVSKKAMTTISQQGDKSKVEQIKEALASGEYKVNLQALSEKIAEELM